jgi:glutamate synthase (NADPH) large chain
VAPAARARCSSSTCRAGRIIDDAELKETLAAAHPYQQWLDKTQITAQDPARQRAAATGDAATLLDRQQAFGYTQEDTRAC